MAKFDVYRRRNGPGYLLDCQADLLDHLTTRFVVPLLPQDAVPRPLDRLHPLFEMGSERLVMATHLAAAIPVAELGARVTSMIAQETMVTNALDMLISGY